MYNTDMAIFFTSDMHMHHKRIREFNPDTRLGSSVEEMNEIMIDNWNSQVSFNDDVYNLGDFCFGTEQQTFDILSRLNGRHHFIYGNHDKVIYKSNRCKELFASMNDYLILRQRDLKIVMFHFPCIAWDSMHYGSIHCFGHVHGSHMNKPRGKSMDVGIDTRPKGLS